MDYNIYLDKFLGLENKTYDFFDYTKYHENYSDFINNFPKVSDFSNLEKNVKIIYEYIKNFKFKDSNIAEYIRYLEFSQIQKLIMMILKQKSKILKIINLEKPISFKKKKRIYLGILWFGIGYYISLMIAKIRKFPTIVNLDRASKNEYLLFLTCCFIYYDDILDTDTLEKEQKKICLEYTQYFFRQVNKKKYRNIEMMSNEFCKIKNLSENLPIISRTNSILNLFFKNFMINPQPNILNKISDLFESELKISELQKKSNDHRVLLQSCLVKSQKSVEAIIQTLYPDLDTGKIEIFELTCQFSFLAQLLDDLNDMEVDIIDKNNTIFTLSEIKGSIDLVWKYIYEIKNVIDSFKIRKEYQQINHYFNILVFNYALGKNKKLCEKYLNFLPLKIQDIEYIRKNKTNYLKNWNIF